MSKSLVTKFQQQFCPFSEKESCRAIATLYKSGAVKSLEESVEKLTELVVDANCNGDYPTFHDTNLMQVVLDYLQSIDYIEKVAIKLDKICKVGYLGYKMDYQENAGEFLFYFDKGWYETLTNDYKDRFNALS